MREILKRAAYLFWQYPILWLPVLLADFLKYCVLTAGHRITLAASFALLNHSVLSSSKEVPSVAELARLPQRQFAVLNLVTSSLTWGANFIGIAMYCYALGVLTRAISGFTPGQVISTSDVETAESAADGNEISYGDSSDIYKLDWTPPRKWLGYSALVFFALFLGIIFGTWIATYLLQTQFRRWNMYFPWYVTVSFLLGALVAIEPILRFISGNLTTKSGLPAVRTGLKRPRVCAYATVVGTTFVYIATWWFSSRILASAIGQIHALQTPVLNSLVWVVDSLVIAIPFIPAMIVLILIQQEMAQSKAEFVSTSEPSLPSAPISPRGNGVSGAASEN